MGDLKRLSKIFLTSIFFLVSLIFLDVLYLMFFFQSRFKCMYIYIYLYICIKHIHIFCLICGTILKQILEN